MGWRLIRRGVSLAFAVIWLLAALVGALHADEAGIIDWHHKLIGTPLEQSTFLHKPVAGSGALGFMLTDRDVLAALNLRDGEIVWRQLLDKPKLVKPLDGSIAVLSGSNNSVVTLFDAQTGHQLAQSPLLSGSPLDLEVLSPDWPGDSARHIVTLSADGSIRRFHHQELAWEASSKDVKGTPRYIATSLSKVYVVYTVPHGKTTGIAVATLDSVTGAILSVHQLDASITVDSDLQVIGSHSSAPLAIWNEKGKLKANILGSKSVVSLQTEHQFTSFSALAPHSSTSLPHFLLSFTDSTLSWADVYHINLATGSITLAYSVPKGPKGSYSLAQIDANVFFGKVTIEHNREQADFEVWGSASHARLGRWSVPFPAGQYGLADISVLEVVTRDDSSVAARVMVTTQDGAIHLLRNDERIWTREESLAHVIPSHTVFLDLPVPEPKVHLNVSTKNLLSAYIDRVTTHIKQLRDLPSGLARFARHFATGRYEEIELGSMNRDAFGLRKFIIVVTGTGKLLALDSANKGNSVWSRLLDVGSKVEGMWMLRESSAVRGQPPLIGVLVTQSGGHKFLQINGLSGKVEDYEEFGKDQIDEIVKAFPAPGGYVDGFGRRIIVCITTQGVVRGLPATTDMSAVLSQMSDKLYYSVQESNAVQGYVVDSSLGGIPTWRFEVPLGSQLVSMSSRAEENVASIGRVLGDRSVLYKYLNPHLLVIAVADQAKSFLTIYLLDNVSGRILHEAKHQGVDISKGIQTHAVENVVYWSHYSTGEFPGQSRGTRITVAELYESTLRNDKYNTTEWTSFDDQIPNVIAQTYLFDQSISALSTTSTRHGIASRDLLIATSNQLIALPKRLLDPRRPVLPKNGKVKGEEKEEGLIAYDPVIPHERKLTISHVYELFGMVNVDTSPALLESTSLVLGSGLDLFYTTIAPSGSFDMLSENFNKTQLLATMLALAIGIIVMRPLVRRKMLKQRWGEQS